MLRPVLASCLLMVVSACGGGTPPSTSLPAPEEGVQIPHFVPRDSEPSLVNADEITDLLAKNYPIQLRRNGISGSVRLFVFVDASGRVTQVSPIDSSNEPAFDRAAESVVRAMEFQPAEFEGESIGVWIQQRIEFTTR